VVSLVFELEKKLEEGAKVQQVCEFPKILKMKVLKLVCGYGFLPPPSTITILIFLYSRTRQKKKKKR